MHDDPVEIKAINLDYNNYFHPRIVERVRRAEGKKTNWNISFCENPTEANANITRPKHARVHVTLRLQNYYFFTSNYDKRR